MDLAGFLRGVLSGVVDASGGRLAAVLVPLFVSGGVVRVLLVRRSFGLRVHGGEFGFPGGVVEEGEGFVEAALREAEEEVGVRREFVEVLGFLDVVRTLTGFAVVPVVGFLRLPEGFRFEVNPAEVEEVFTPPLWELFRHEYVDLTGTYYLYDGRRVWGATARILSQLRRRLGSACPQL